MDNPDQQSPTPTPQVAQEPQAPTQAHFSFKPIYFLLMIIFLLLIGGGVYYWLSQSSQPSSLMEVKTSELCDIKEDGVCNDEDIKLVESVIGQCRGGSGYYLMADADADGCITAQDRVLLFPNEPYTAPADETANWKAYKGKSFEFKYPPNGAIMNESSNVIYVSYKEGTKPYWTFTVNTADNPSHLTTRQAVDKIISDIRNNKNAPWAKSQADQVQQTMKDYVNGKVNGIKLQSFFEGYPQKFGQVVEAKDNKIYTFYIGSSIGGSINDDDEKLLDKILSTFIYL